MRGERGNGGIRPRGGLRKDPKPPLSPECGDLGLPLSSPHVMALHFGTSPPPPPPPKRGARQGERAAGSRRGSTGGSLKKAQRDSRRGAR
jgi:hypothetical protein